MISMRRLPSIARPSAWTCTSDARGTPTSRSSHRRSSSFFFENPGAPRLNHLGVEVFDDASVAAAGERLREAGLVPVAEEREVCCFAEQNKVSTHDPQGMRWEWYRITDDAPATGPSARDGAAAVGYDDTEALDGAPSPSPCCST